MCCDNPIELDCVSSCGNIILPIAITIDHTVKTSFNGSVFNVDFALNQSNYPVLSKENLNEDYTYTFGVYDASGDNVGCYKLSIHPTAICCGDELVSTTNVVADYATFNSDAFLELYIGSGNQYGYECISAEYNGTKLNISNSVMWFDEINLEETPVQIAPRDTIVAHDNVGGILQYSGSWLTFLESLQIADYLTFRSSPFKDFSLNTNKGEKNFPLTEMQIAVSLNGTDWGIYGEGFQIEYSKGATFKFTVKFWYRVGTNDATAISGHTIVFKDDYYSIDGGIVYPANKREIQSV